MDRTVLVVDDSSTIRKFVTFALRARGHRVLAAQDGLEALETLAREPVDLVVTDLNMPRLDGYGLVRAVREAPETSAMPVIILSSLGKEEEIEEGIAAGANAYLVKPFDPKRIQYEVAKYLA